LSIKKAVILVAGYEKKLSPLTDEMHQCLFKLGDTTVIENMLTKLGNQGIKEAILIVGHKAEIIKQKLKDKFKGLKIKYIYNREFKKTNVIYSLWLARHELNDAFLLIDGDLICEEDLLSNIIHAKQKDVIAIDFSIQPSKNHIVAKIVKNEVVSVGKNLKVKRDSLFGQSVGIEKFSSKTASLFINEMDNLIKKGKKQLYYEDALNLILNKIHLFALDVRGFNWLEIDRTEEFEKAKKLFGNTADLKKQAKVLGATEVYTIFPSDLIFDERARLKCFDCKNYNQKNTCPPKIPNLDYKNILLKYKKGLIVAVKMKFNNKNLERKRRESTNKLHKILLKLEKSAFNQDNHYTLSFIGGSCKLCSNGCSPTCKFPQASRIPVEATGVDVVETLKKLGLSLKFPAKKYFYRVGLLMVG